MSDQDHGSVGLQASPVSPSPTLESNSEPSTFGVGAAWRRGIMHAVERLDLILSPRRKLNKRDLVAAVAASRRALDDLAELARANMPGSYKAAFAICSDDLQRAITALDGSQASSPRDGEGEADRTQNPEPPGPSHV